MICIFDTETTGFKGDVMELGSVIITDTGEMYHFNERCKPIEPVSKGAFETHGISDEDVADCRSSSVVVNEWFNDIKELALRVKEDVVFCAHNLVFDMGILKQHISLEPEKRVCSLEAARRLFPELPSKSLGDLYTYFGLKEEVKAHSALDDCLMVHRILPYLMSDYYAEAHYQLPFALEKARLKAIEDAKPPKMLERVLTGKKNKGKLFTDVTKSDLEWMYNNMLNNKDVIYTTGVLLGKH
jgi:DNA polymerase-3 subunit epsilon